MSKREDDNEPNVTLVLAYYTFTFLLPYLYPSIPKLDQNIATTVCHRHHASISDNLEYNLKRRISPCGSSQRQGSLFIVLSKTNVSFVFSSLDYT